MSHCAINIFDQFIFYPPHAILALQKKQKLVLLIQNLWHVEAQIMTYSF